MMMHGSPSRARSQTGGVDHNGTHTVARVAASPRHAHWEAVEQLFCYSPHTPDPHFAHAEVSSPQKGLSKRDGSNAVDQHAILGHVSPIIESGHTAATHGGKEASRPCSPASYTTHKRRDHPIHHHTGATSGQRFHQGPPFKHSMSHRLPCALDLELTISTL